jgi:hypothetical protein
MVELHEASIQVVGFLVPGPHRYRRPRDLQIDVGRTRLHFDVKVRFVEAIGAGPAPEDPGAFRAESFKTCGLPALTWYQATRHTFASQFVLGSGSIEKLSKIMRHASVTTTERYAHLRTDLFRESDLDVVAVDLSTPAGNLVPLAPKTSENGAVGYVVVTGHNSQTEEVALTG